MKREKCWWFNGWCYLCTTLYSGTKLSIIHTVVMLVSHTRINQNPRTYGNTVTDSTNFSNGPSYFYYRWRRYHPDREIHSLSSTSIRSTTPVFTHWLPLSRYLIVDSTGFFLDDLHRYLSDLHVHRGLYCWY